MVEDYDRWRNPTSRPVITFMLSGYAELLSFSRPANLRQMSRGYDKRSACGKPGYLDTILFGAEASAS